MDSLLYIDRPQTHNPDPVSSGTSVARGRRFWWEGSKLPSPSKAFYRKRRSHLVAYLYVDLRCSILPVNTICVIHLPSNSIARFHHRLQNGIAISFLPFQWLLPYFWHGPSAIDYGVRFPHGHLLGDPLRGFHSQERSGHRPNMHVVLERQDPPGRGIKVQMQKEYHRVRRVAMFVPTMEFGRKLINWIWATMDFKFLNEWRKERLNEVEEEKRVLILPRPVITKYLLPITK